MKVKTSPARRKIVDVMTLKGLAPATQENDQRSVSVLARDCGRAPRNLSADEHVPDAIRIVDIFHAKQHVFDVARPLCGKGRDLAAQWGKARRDELDHGRLDLVIAELRKHATTVTKRHGTSSTSGTIPHAWIIPGSGDRVCACRRVSSRVHANH